MESPTLVPSPFLSMARRACAAMRYYQVGPLAAAAPPDIASQVCTTKQSYMGITHHSSMFFIRVSYFIIFLLHHPSSAPLSTLSSSWPHPLASKGSIAEMSFASAERSERITLGGSPPGLAAHGRRHPGGHRLRTGIEHIKI